ncbi:MAG TPA: HEAT repeat domain-containing protein [Gemmataceae bacterium]|nr:HEAT repeat domain-containing protein [Gemmataceae bacterium]
MYLKLGTMLFAAGLLLAGHYTVSAQFVMWNGMGMMMDEGYGTMSASPSPSGSGDEGLLRSLGISPDGPGLLTYFHVRGRGQVKPEQLAALIEQLGDKSPLAARKACAELTAIGAAAVPALRQAVKDPDRYQIARLAQRCLQVLEQNPGQLSSSAVRLIAQHRPAGAAEALLEFAPQAEDDGVIEEIRLALAAVVSPSGPGGAGHSQADRGREKAALLKAIQDESPIRRALAIDTLCHNGITPALLQQVPLRQLLQDSNGLVRLHAALALSRGHDAKAVSTLITLFTEVPLQQARQVEEFLTEFAGDNAPKATLGSDSAARSKCRDAWATWWQASEDDNRLLDEVRKRTVTEALRKKCEDLIKKLGDADFAIREKAQAEVKAMGSLIVPLLRHAARNSDLEIRSRARDCLSQMERDKNVPLAPITPRLIALRKPAGAADTLLAYTPYADEETSLPEVQLALNAVALLRGKPEEAVVRALSDSQAARRAAAAEALCLGGDRTHLPAIRKLLADSNRSVRMKVALALAGIGQRDAVPALIDVLGELPSAESEPAEEYLQRLAGDKPPANLPSGDDSASRKKRQQAWAAWWKANGERIALVDRYPPEGTERYLGHILLAIANTGEALELDRDRKERWKLSGLANPRDVQVTGNDRILVAEWSGQRVTERNRRGEIIWQKQTPGCNPVAAQRLRNGHTFIACQNKLMEVDRAGNEVYSINRQQHDVVMARRMRDGQIVLVSSQQQCIRMDTTGKQLKSFQHQCPWQTGVDILPNGHIIIPTTWFNKLTEYDADGKIVVDLNVNQPWAATRLKNGNLLMAPQQWPSELIEMDSTGKQLSKLNLPNFPYCIRTR